MPKPFDEAITRQRVDDLRELVDDCAAAPEFRETLEALVSFYMKYRHLEERDPHALESARRELSFHVPEGTVSAIEDLVKAKLDTMLREKLG